MAKRRTTSKPRKEPKAKKRRTKEGKSAEKKKRTRKKDVMLVCEWLEDVDIQELRDAVIVHVESEHHVGCFDDRKQTWKHITTNIVALDLLLTSLLAEFIEIYKRHSKGKDKYMGLLLDWYNCMEQYVVAGNTKGDQAWSLLVSDTENSENTRPFLLPSLIMGCFHELLKRVECQVIELSVSTSTFPSETGYRDEDETSLYRLAGFAIFSCIHLRQHRLMWKKKLDVSQSTAENYRAELTILKQLVDLQKTDLPPAIAIQDRGHMTFIIPALIPFVKNVASEIRKVLNYQQYSKHGKEFFKVTLHAPGVLVITYPIVPFCSFLQFVRQQIPIESLSSAFRACAQAHLIHVADNRVMNSVCEQLVIKISHTMSNDFLRNIATLENAKENKAVDAQVSLRDKLKSFASHTLSRFSNDI